MNKMNAQTMTLEQIRAAWLDGQDVDTIARRIQEKRKKYRTE